MSAGRPPVEDARACHMAHPHSAHRWDTEDREPLRYACPGAASRALPSDQPRPVYGHPEALATAQAARRPAVPSDHTATTEDADLRDRLQEVIAPVVAPYTSGPMDPLDLQVVDAVMGLLATAPSTAATEDAVADLLGRMARAVNLLEGLRGEHWDPAERQRLQGKVEGVKLAIGYVKEARGLLATARPDTTTDLVDTPAVREVQAQALEAAADAADKTLTTQDRVGRLMATADWLRERAAAIREGAGS